VAERIGMTDGRQWQPAGYEAPHTFPGGGSSGAAIMRVARAIRPGTERASAPLDSRALRNNHPPPVAAICLLLGWVRACAAEAQLSPRSAHKGDSQCSVSVS
jgi:hypothetical protein